MYYNIIVGEMASALGTLRAIGYTASIVLHWGNIINMSRVDFNSFENKNIQTFGSLQNRYLTCWTFVSILFVIKLVCLSIY